MKISPMKKSREFSKLSKGMIIALSIVAVILLVITILDRTGLKTINNLLPYHGAGLLVLMFLFWGGAKLVMKLQKKGSRIALGTLFGIILIFVGSWLFAVSAQYGTLMLQEEYAKLTAPSGQKIVLMRALDTGFESEEASAAMLERMRTRYDAVADKYPVNPDDPSTDPESDEFTFPEEAFGFAFKAYPVKAFFFYNPDEAYEGTIYLGYTSESKIFSDTDEDGTLRIYVNEPTVGDFGEIAVR